MLVVSHLVHIPTHVLPLSLFFYDRKHLVLAYPPFTSTTMQPTTTAAIDVILFLAYLLPCYPLHFSLSHSNAAQCTGQTPDLAFLWLSVRPQVQNGAFNSVPSSSVWWWVLAGPQASRPVQTYENAVWVWCHLRIKLELAAHFPNHFCSAFSYTATSLSRFHSTNTSYKFGPRPLCTVHFYCVYFYMLWKMFPHLIFVLFFIHLKSYGKKILLSTCIKFLSFKNGEVFESVLTV